MSFPHYYSVYQLTSGKSRWTLLCILYYSTMFIAFQSSNFPKFTSASSTINGSAFCEHIHQAYECIVYRIHNLFLVPYGSAVSDFITKLAKLYESFTSISAVECIALKAATCSSPENSWSKSCKNIKHLECCLCLWHGMILMLCLWIEDHIIQQHLQYSQCIPWLTALAYLLMP